MSTPALQWAQLVSQMGAQGVDAIAQGAAAGTAARNADIKQQQADIEKQQEQRQAQQWDMDWHQHMMDQRALPVVNGMVKESVPMPPVVSTVLSALQSGSAQPTSPLFDDQGNPSPAASGTSVGPSAQLMQAMNPQPAQGNLTVMRKADPSRIAKHVDATGDTAYYEIPTAEQQKNYQIQDAIARARAAALGQAQGQTQGDVANRAAQGTQLPDTLADQYGYPRGTVLTPQELNAAATKYDTVRRQDSANTGAFNRTKYRADSVAQTAQNKLDLQDSEFQTRQDNIDRWNQTADATKRWLSLQTTGRQKVSQTAVDARGFLNNLSRNSELDSTLGKSILQEHQKQIGANGILGNDPTGAPNVQDGEPFIDPFSGKQVVMNAAQRLILGQRRDASAKQTTDWLATRAGLQNQRDGLLQRIGGSPAPTAGGSGSPGAAAPAGSGTPGPVAAPAAAPQSAAPPTPGAPTRRPANWADAARAEAGPSAALPGRSGSPPPRAGAPGGAPQSMKPPTRGAQLPANIAAQYLLQEGGDKNKARAAATADGWKF